MADKEILSEKDFIHEPKGQGPLPLWLFLIIVTAIFSILWVGGNWLFQNLQTKVDNALFLQVTNRQMSLFLWQHPELMRIHAANKTGYLPGFHSNGAVNPQLETVDNYVQAPPEVLFQYHTWDRLLGNYLIKRPIPREEFMEFLDACPEWKPQNWKGAKEEYKDFVKEFSLIQGEDLQSLPLSVLPKEVRMAFIGWKNYFHEGEEINRFQPTVAQVRRFLEKYPHYSRSYWRNLYPLYLQTLLNPPSDDTVPLPEKEVPSFLRAALYSSEVTKPNL